MAESKQPDFLDFRMRENTIVVRDRKKNSSADYKVFLCGFFSILFQLPRNVRLYEIRDVSVLELHEINRVSITVVVWYRIAVEGKKKNVVSSLIGNLMKGVYFWIR